MFDPEASSDASLEASLDDRFRAALAAGDGAAVRALCARHPTARALLDAPVFPFDAPAIVYCAGAGDLAMVELLLELGADPNRKSDWWAGGFHALHSARGEVADRLLAAGAVPDACAAAQLDRIDLLREMLDDDPARVHERGGDGQTPLHFARSREVVDLLLSRGADIDARDLDHRSTPAQWMLDRTRGAGRYALAAYLVERGARADVFLAAALGRTETLRSLLDTNPSVLELRTSQGDYGAKPPGSDAIYTWTLGRNLSPFQVAAQFGQEEASAVLGAYATPKVRLLAALANGQAAEAERLLAKSPGLIEALGTDEMRVLPDAAWGGRSAAVDLMLRVGVDPAARGQDGGTVLHCAAWQGMVECVEVALRYERVRALLETADPVHGSTPLGWCCHGARYGGNPAGDYPAVARALLDAGARPGPNLDDAPPEVLAVIRAYGAG